MNDLVPMLAMTFGCIAIGIIVVNLFLAAVEMFFGWLDAGVPSTPPKTVARKRLRSRVKRTPSTKKA